MKKIWIPIKNYPNYLISNTGQIKNKTTKLILKPFKSSNIYCVGLSKNGKTNHFSLARLIVKHFQPHQLRKKHWVLHLDLDHSNNKNNNLMSMKIGDFKRYTNTMKNKKRGVYRFKIKKSNGKGYYNKFRAVIKVNGKTKTIGYSECRDHAEMIYLEGFNKHYGYYPYT